MTQTNISGPPAENRPPFLEIDRPLIPGSATTIHAMVATAIQEHDIPAMEAVPPRELAASVITGGMSNFLELSVPQFGELDPQTLENELRQHMHGWGWQGMTMALGRISTRPPTEEHDGSVYIQAISEPLSAERLAIGNALGTMIGVRPRISPHSKIKLARLGLADAENPELARVLHNLQRRFPRGQRYAIASKAVFRFRGRPSQLL